MLLRSELLSFNIHVLTRGYVIANLKIKVSQTNPGFSFLMLVKP